VLSISGSLIGCTDRTADSGENDNRLTGIVDHHVHVLGPDIVRDWKSVGVTFSRPDSIYLSVASLLTRHGDSLAAVTLVPMSHLYANPEFVSALAIDSAEVHRRVRRENAWVAAEAARYPGKATALCSVPVLRRGRRRARVVCDSPCGGVKITWPVRRSTFATRHI
jgi:hypothetical protein